MGMILFSYLLLLHEAQRPQAKLTSPPSSGGLGGLRVSYSGRVMWHTLANEIWGEVCWGLLGTFLFVPTEFLGATPLPWNYSSNWSLGFRQLPFCLKKQLIHKAPRAKRLAGRQIGSHWQRQPWSLLFVCTSSLKVKIIFLLWVNLIWVGFLIPTVKGTLTTLQIKKNQ